MLLIISTVRILNENSDVKNDVENYIRAYIGKYVGNWDRKRRDFLNTGFSN